MSWSLYTQCPVSIVLLVAVGVFGISDGAVSHQLVCVVTVYRGAKMLFTRIYMFFSYN